MWMPCHPLRRLLCKVLMRQFDFTSSVCRNIDLRSPYRISIGKNSVINKNCVLDGRGSLIIGNNVDIAQDVYIWTESHAYNNPEYGSVCNPVIIEDDVWIASRATILPGVTIGRGAVVASGAVVTKSVSPFSVMAGVPAKEIGKRNNDLKYKLEFNAWFK